VDLSAELEDMIEDARVLAADLRLTFETHLASGLRVPADRALLHTALLNLITNAIKYNQPDGKLAISLEHSDGEIEFRIGNTGPSIPAGDQPKVFERFYRVGRADTSRADGVGLGLSLAREIVRAHGGELSLQESRPGWTCFMVTLKLPPDNG
jgi:signal transduction histidine kinase